MNITAAGPSLIRASFTPNFKKASAEIDPCGGKRNGEKASIKLM